MDYNGLRWVCKCGACDVLISYYEPNDLRCRICGDVFKYILKNNLDKLFKLS